MSFSLTAVFGLDATGLKSELKTLGSDVTSFASKWAKIGLAAGAAAFVMLSKSAIELAGHLTDITSNLGVNAEAFQALENQHKRNGVAQEQLVKGLEKTKSAVIDAAGGNEKAANALAALGLNAQRLIRLPLAEQYAAIAKGAAKAADKNQAFAAVADLFGEKIGPKFMGSLKELADIGLPALIKAEKEAGRVMDNEVRVALDKAGDAIDDFKRKATIAVGNIIVNFRSEEGIKLLWTQLSGVFIKLGATWLDALTYPVKLAVNVLWAGLKAVTEMFGDAMLTAFISVATQVNKVLPKKWEINISGLENLKSAGVDLGDVITRAIANTSPTSIREVADKFVGEMVASASTVVAATSEAFKVAEKAAASKAAADAITGLVIRDAMAAAKETALTAAAAAKVAAAAADAAAVVAAEFRTLVNTYSSLTRTGKGYEDQSTASLLGVQGRLRGNLANAELEDRNRTGMGSGFPSAGTSFLNSELERIERELALRAQVQGVATRLGEGAARAQFGDTVTDRALREMQDSSARTMTATETMNLNLKALNTALGITPKG